MTHKCLFLITCAFAVVANTAAGQVRVPPPASPVTPDSQRYQSSEGYISTARAEPSCGSARDKGDRQQIQLIVEIAEIDWTESQSQQLQQILFKHSTCRELKGPAGAAAAAVCGVATPRVRAFIHLLRSYNVAKSLAAPRMVTLNGRSATFLSGGHVPVAKKSGPDHTPVMETIPFGTQVRLTPEVQSPDEILLTIEVNVSNVAWETVSHGNRNLSVPNVHNRSLEAAARIKKGETLVLIAPEDLAGHHEVKNGAKKRTQLIFLVRPEWSAPPPAPIAAVKSSFATVPPAPAAINPVAASSYPSKTKPAPAKKTAHDWSMIANPTGELTVKTATGNLATIGRKNWAVGKNQVLRIVPGNNEIQIVAPGWKAVAHRVASSRQPHVVILEGNVRVAFDNQGGQAHLRAERVLVNLHNGWFSLRSEAGTGKAND